MEPQHPPKPNMRSAYEVGQLIARAGSIIVCDGMGEASWKRFVREQKKVAGLDRHPAP